MRWGHCVQTLHIQLPSFCCNSLKRPSGHRSVSSHSESVPLIFKASFQSIEASQHVASSSADSIPARSVPDAEVLEERRRSHNGTSTSNRDDDIPHVPVLLEEVLLAFRGRTMCTFVDGTLGAGGHSAAVLSQHPDMQQLIGIDKDPVAHAIAQRRLEQTIAETQSSVTLQQVLGDFRGLKRHLKEVQGTFTPGAISGILLDLGMSSMQVDNAERGFSFVQDGPLDMRMGPSAVSSAEDIVNSWSEADLGHIFREYGEERAWRHIAQRIVERREEKPIRTTLQLAAAIGFQGRNKGTARRQSGAKQIHPATRVFQALRIAVNDELGALEAAIPDAIDALAPGGRLAIISFHSLEDRAVKWAFLRAAGRATPEDEQHGPRWQLDSMGSSSDKRTAVAKIITKRPLLAQEQEAASNPRSRSAKLRVLEKF